MDRIGRCRLIFILLFYFSDRAILCHACLYLCLCVVCKHFCWDIFDSPSLTHILPPQHKPLLQETNKTYNRQDVLQFK